MERKNNRRKRYNRIKRFGVSALAIALLLGDCAFPRWDGSVVRSSLVALAQDDGVPNVGGENLITQIEGIPVEEALPGSEAKEVTENIENADTVDISENTQNVENSENTEKADDTVKPDATANTQNVEDSQNTDNANDIDQPDATENVDSTEKVETTENTEKVETTENTETTEKTQSTEKVETKEKVENKPADAQKDASAQADPGKKKATKNTNVDPFKILEDNGLKVDVLREGETTVTISSLKDLYVFSEEYDAYSSEYSTCNLNFSTTDTLELYDSYEFNTEDGDEYHYFVPIGTSSDPYMGKITFNVANDMVPIYLQSPLFDYIADSVEIVRTSGDGKVTLSLIRIENVAFDGTEENAIPTENEALFAQHVVHDYREGATSATWRIMASPADASYGYDNSGLFGVVGDEYDSGATVNVEYQSSCVGSSASMDIKSTESAGLICGVINQSSIVNVKLSGLNSGYEVKSSDGAVGSLVGEMHDGSELNVCLDGFDLSVSKDIIGYTYAGGLVGYNDGGRVTVKNADGSADQFYTAQGNIKATGDESVVGGLFGYYRNAMDDTIDFSTQYSVDASLYGNIVGGAFGILQNDASLSLTSVLTKDAAPYCSINVVKGTGDGIFGGVAGAYVSYDMLNTLELTDMQLNTATVSDPEVYGGVIGRIGTENSTGGAAYVKMDNIIHNASQGYNKSNGYFGGLIADAGNNGSFLDTGNVTVSTANNAYFGGGLVGRLRKGVLRLSGITDLSIAPTCAANDTNGTKNRGQLVAQLGDSLVYALGDGETDAGSASYGNGWRFVRSTMDAAADDFGTWGEVVRIAGIEGANGALTFDATNHKVTLKAAVRSMATPMDFVKTALNMQLNAGSNLGALYFADRTNSTRNVLLAATNLEMTDDISLAGTGITGLMRDDYLSNVDQIGQFTGTFDGNGHTLTLQTGEHYGVYTAGGNTVGRGAIFTHRYNGLFARTGTNAQVKELTIDGTMHVHSKCDGQLTCVGGVVAVVENGLTLTDVQISKGSGDADSKLSIVFDAMNGPSSGTGRYVGGMIGMVESNNGADITIGKSDGAQDILIAPVIMVTGSIGNDDGGNEFHAFGGMIGYVRSVKTFTMDISDVILSAKMDSSAVSNTQTGIAGLIADINSNGTTDTRTLELTNINAKNTLVQSHASSSAGGIFGYRWNNTDVTLDHVELSQNNRLVGTSTYAGGLVHRATGHWSLPSGALTINALSAEFGSGTAFGMILLDGYYGSAGVYMDLQATDSYTIATSNITVPTGWSVYDELVAYTSSGTNYLNNGNGIVSITTSNELMSMDGANCNTYQNVYNKTQVNEHARYYYNINTIRSKAQDARSDGEKLLLWSLNRYATSNLKKYFDNAFAQGNSDVISGTFDLVNLSYYPINIGTGVTLGDVSVIFYNNEIEATEAAASGNTDEHVRSTRSASQHYLMHSALFKNVTSGVTTTGNLHFKGNVGSDATYSGVFINGTVSGTVATATDKEIVLEGITLSNDTGYLLIHRVSDDSTLTLSGVRAGGSRKFADNSVDNTEAKYAAGATVAKSLIGDITGEGLTVNFSRMQLDARVVENAYNSDSNPLNAIYGTTKTLFSSATFMNSFAVDVNTLGVYNFNEDEDWSGTTHVGHVTYGWEINESLQYEDQQKCYFDTESYTSPTTPQSASEFEDFSDKNKFRPYVAVIDSSQGKREIKVNVKIIGLTTGCGAYNHPYEITSGAQLVTVAKAINGTGLPDSLVLPKVNNPNVETMEHWCEGKTSCAEFTHSGSNYVYSENATNYSWSETQVRRYLAGAYYRVMNEIKITAKMEYPGLGAPASDGANGTYAFRGVIVGKNTGDGSPCVKIINQSACTNIDGTTANNSNNKNTFGLISMSNGAVVKDLIIEVDLTEVSTENYKVVVSKSYAYNEQFPSYGAVMNKIMGGDNIIDNVTVQFKRNASDQVVPFKIGLDASNNKDYLSVIGGFVGSVVNGGLIFRNVDDSNLIDFTVKRLQSNGTLKNEDLTSGSALSHLYINPFVGRVINGYAIRETSGSGAKYSFSEDGTYGDGKTRPNAVTVTMHNTGKNFSIPDINRDSANKLTFKQKTGSGTYNLIEIPDSQSMYIMGLIAQSGSGCATSETGAYAYRLSYDGNKQRTYTNAATESNHVDTYRATHLAEYSQVGTPESDKTAVPDYLEAAKDLVNSQVCVPYLIYRYTTSYNNNGLKYPARTLTQRTFFIELADTTYYLPDSFRGIGFLGSSDTKDSMKIYGFQGAGVDSSVIDLNSNFYTYQLGNNPYDTSKYCTGVALFNVLTQDNGNGISNMGYNADEDYHICKFTLSGYVSANCRATSGAKQYGTSSSAGDQICYTSGVLAYNNVDNRQFTFSDIEFKGLHVDGCAHTGSMISRTNKGMVYVDNCNADGLTVDGSGRVGGFFGYMDTETNGGGLHMNTNSEDAQSELRNLAVYNHYTSSISDKLNYTGGVVSSFYTNNKPAPSRDDGNIVGALIIRNVTLEGGNPQTSYIGNKDKPGGAVGGILGSAENNAQGCLIMNCQVKNINLYGRQVGGIVGRAHGTKGNVRVRIANCSVSGDLNSEDHVQYQMYALLNAGGVVGYITDNNPGFTGSQAYTIHNPVYDGVEYTAEMDGVSVYGYHVYCANTGNVTTDSTTDNLYDRYCAGGLIGYTRFERRIRNAKVEKCVMEVGGISGGRIACGGLVGRCEGDLYGYNLLAKDLDFQYHQTVNGKVDDEHVWLAYKTDTNDPTEAIRCGNLVAKNDTAGDYIISLVGVHVENCPADYDIRECSETEGNIHVVYADYTGASGGIGPGKKMSDINPATNIGAGAKGDYFPYVVTSPYTVMGGTYPDDAVLTGDGAKVISNNGNKTIVADGILNDIDGGTAKNRYQNFNTGDDTIVKTMRTNARPDQNLTEEKDVKLTTYETEMVMPAGVADFSILSLGGAASGANYTNEITSYIRLLTNTTYDYQGDIPGKYKIEIKACRYIDGQYQVVNENAGLYRDNSNRYIMRVDAADTIQPNNQFSLVDVSFFSPMDPNEVAYHLYIPVLTRKMTEFNFRSSAMQGTEYVRNEYTFGNKIAGTFDNWITTYFEYVYTASEINTLLASGRGLYWNNDKKVQLAYQMTQDMADSTQFILLDPNSNTDKEFYLDKSAVTTNLPSGSNATDVIDLSQFTTMRNGREQLQEEAHFAPQYLNDIADKLIVYSNAQTAQNRVYTVTNDPTQAIAYGYDAQGNNKLYFKKATGTEADEARYALTATADICEGYYLSMYAYDEDNVFDLSARTNEAYIFNIECPLNLTGAVTVKRKVHNPATVIIGNLFEQTLTITELVTDTTMTTSNNTLTATLTSTISFKESANTTVFQNILSAANIQLHQGFMVYLKRYDANENLSDDQLIKGSPQYSYTIENAEHAAAGENSTLEDNAAYLYIPPVSITIPEHGDTPWSSTQVAHVTFTYDEDDDVIQREFPVREDEGDQSGVSFYVSANVAYEADKVSYSGQLVTEEDSNRYHTLKQEKAELTLIALEQEMDDAYDIKGELSKNRSALGINAKYIDTGKMYESEGDYQHIEATSNFDVSQLPSNILDGTYSLVYTLELSQKQNDNTTAGFKYVPVSIDNYLSDFTLYGKNATALTPITTTGGVYTYKIPLVDDPSSWPVEYSNKQFNAKLAFDAKTGAALEAVNGYLYSNYKVTMTAKIVKTNNAGFGYEGDSDHIIYTNAKVNAAYVNSH